MSREHYNLIQRTEAAQTPQQVDDILLHEVAVVRRRLEDRAPTSPECVEILVLLLYCWTATTLGHVKRTALEFALPHAVTLAEAGSTLKQKRTGYLFCTEVMSESDELQIMLVNTLRKDLEDQGVARICLALDVLLLNCPPEAIPAVSPRLLDLLAHNSPLVKTKSMGVIRRLGHLEPDILSSVSDKVILRLKDPDSRVVGSALGLLKNLVRAHIFGCQEALKLVLQEFLSIDTRKTQTQRPQIRFIQTIGELLSEPAANGLEPEIVEQVIETLYKTIEGATDTQHAIILASFRALSNFPVQSLRQQSALSGSQHVSVVGRLLNSHNPNIQYACVSCLLVMDASLWAGTVGDIPAAFDESQVHTIMGLLNSRDSLIRTTTLKILNRVDREILSMHLTQLFKSSAYHDRSRWAERVLEVSAVYDENGGTYASRLREVATKMIDQGRSEGKIRSTDSGVRLVSENVVEHVLLHLRNSLDGFCRAFVDTIVWIPVSNAGPTLTLVIAASVCEYGALSSIPQEDLLRGLAGRLETNSPAIQEALLLAMLRVTARCGSSLPDVSDEVRKLSGESRRHIRRRCQQYLTLSEQMGSLKYIAQCANSDALPDFLLALESTEPRSQMSPQPDKSISASEGATSPRSSVAAGKLRYKAYDPPRPAAKLIRRPSSTSVHSLTPSSRSGRSNSTSSHSQKRHGTESDINAVTDDGLSRTLTAGDLALAAHEPDFSKSGSIPSSGPQATDKYRLDPNARLIEDLMTKNDLIALDSPFLAEPPQSAINLDGKRFIVDFRSAWDALKDGATLRGWCERSPEQVREGFLALPNRHITATSPEVEPYRGEIKLVISCNVAGTLAGSGLGFLAAIRLRPGDEGSTLWQLRCLDSTMRAELTELVGD